MAATEVFLVSDLHFGGDGQLQDCDFADEFIAFLADLAKRGPGCELILAGDTFGFWELTRIDGPAKLDEIIAHHQAIFEQLRRTGAAITITMMAGNHDYDLACDPAFAERLAAYNITLDPSLTVVREVGGRLLYVEHGQQVDTFNASPDYGNPYALPLGYFVTETVVGGASRYAEFGKGDWLKDIRSVRTTQIPDWLLSNYFYREMGPVVRTGLTLFLVLVTVTVAALALEVARQTGLVQANLLLDNRVLAWTGPVGEVLRGIVWANMVLMAGIAIAAVPLGLILRDVRVTLRRFQRHNAEKARTNILSPRPYIARARQLFAEQPDAAIYAFGHIHDAFLHKESDGRVVLNTGTWLKIFRRVPARFRFMPAVYVPTFRLSYFHIYPSAAPGQAAEIAYGEMPKTAARELSWLQKLMIWPRRPAGGYRIPERVSVPAR